MKSIIGNNLQFSLFGESHGPFIGATLNGLPSGIYIDNDFIKKQMNLRKPKGKISTNRVESDEVKIISGVFNNYTTGTPLTFIIENSNQHSKDYTKTATIARPSHADYTANVKYHGYQDYRGGGHFSGRLTAPIVAAGAIIISILKAKEIYIGSHIKKISKIEDENFSTNTNEIIKQINKLNNQYFATINDDVNIKMHEVIEEAFNNQDSIGGIIESCILGVPSGVGEPYFHSIESIISQYLFSIGGIKGVEFGSGFEFSNLYGSIANDELIIKDGKVQTSTNHNGGINGGISNGMPIIIKSAIKPTPSIYKEQNTVDFKTNKETTLTINGRHDPCIVHRIRVVIDSVLALAIIDLLIERYGINYFAPKSND